MLFRGEVEEMRNSLYPERLQWHLKSEKDMEQFMMRIIDHRFTNLYQQHIVTPACKTIKQAIYSLLPFKVVTETTCKSIIRG